MTWPYGTGAGRSCARAQRVPVFVLDARSLDVLPSQIARLDAAGGTPAGPERWRRRGPRASKGVARATAARRASSVFYEVWHAPLYTV
ncbi:MAG: hypothetical protein IPH55_08520, partial [Betaproteobacteria bacterium]|nr:hypothetical protein [Betaproteobacteria bacterium]